MYILGANMCILGVDVHFRSYSIMSILGVNMSILGANMYILSVTMYISGANVSILGANM